MIIFYSSQKKNIFRKFWTGIRLLTGLFAAQKNINFTILGDTS